MYYFQSTTTNGANYLRMHPRKISLFLAIKSELFRLSIYLRWNLVNNLFYAVCQILLDLGVPLNNQSVGQNGHHEYCN